ncbi:hypothetical protein AC1031_009458 [Aphanomyces cochlioides]|nr:hypothetical protein AC1031_009458 [Aphanomyces cochlioides]
MDTYPENARYPVDVDRKTIRDLKTAQEAQTEVTGTHRRLCARIQLVLTSKPEKRGTRSRPKEAAQTLSNLPTLTKLSHPVPYPDFYPLPDPDSHSALRDPNSDHIVTPITPTFPCRKSGMTMTFDDVVPPTQHAVDSPLNPTKKNQPDSINPCMILPNPDSINPSLALPTLPGSEPKTDSDSNLVRRTTTDFKNPPSDYTKRYQNHADRDVLTPRPTWDKSGLSSPSLVKTKPLIEPPVVFVSKLSESLSITSGDRLLTFEYETDDASTPFDLPPLEPVSDDELDNKSGSDELETKPTEIHQKSSLHSEASSVAKLVTNPLNEPDQPDLSGAPDLTPNSLRSNEIPAPVFTPAQLEAIVTGDFVGIPESVADIEDRMMPISSAYIESQIRRIRSRRKDPAHTDLVTAITKTLKM